MDIFVKTATAFNDFVLFSRAGDNKWSADVNEKIIAQIIINKYGEGQYGYVRINSEECEW